MTPATRKAHARAVASGHPSVARSSAPELSGSAASAVEWTAGERGSGRTRYPAPVRSDVVDAPPPRDTMSGDGGSAAAESPSTPFDDFHATVTDINDAADRLRRLRAGRHE